MQVHEILNDIMTTAGNNHENYLQFNDTSVSYDCHLSFCDFLDADSYDNSLPFLPNVPNTSFENI